MVWVSRPAQVTSGSTQVMWLSMMMSSATLVPPARASSSPVTWTTVSRVWHLGTRVSKLRKRRLLGELQARRFERVQGFVWFHPLGCASCAPSARTTSCKVCFLQPFPANSGKTFLLPE